jgi:hypothetical protein
MFFNIIRRAARRMERLSGADSHATVAVNTGGRGRLTAVSRVSTSRQGGDLENDDQRSTDDERRGSNVG